LTGRGVFEKAKLVVAKNLLSGSIRQDLTFVFDFRFAFEFVGHIYVGNQKIHTFYLPCG
jgi:hypothetical protein